MAAIDAKGMISITHDSSQGSNTGAGESLENMGPQKHAGSVALGRCDEGSHASLDRDVCL